MNPSKQDQDAIRDEVEDIEYQEEAYEDDEATLAEEETLSDEDFDDELRDLQEDGELTVEQLRSKYYGGAPEQDNVLSVSTVLHETNNHLSVSGEDDLAFDEEDDVDYVEEHVSHYRLIKVGDEFQAVIPQLQKKTLLGKRKFDEENTAAVIASDGLKIWEPTDKLTDEQIKSFIILTLGNESTNCLKQEQLYQLLYLSHYQLDVASQLYPEHAPTGHYPSKTIPPHGIFVPFTEAEYKLFENGLGEHEKNFFKIHKEFLPNRSVGELVYEYYFWKKTVRYGNFFGAVKAEHQHQRELKAARKLERIQRNHERNILSDAEPTTTPSYTEDESSQSVEANAEYAQHLENGVITTEDESSQSVGTGIQYSQHSENEVITTEEDIDSPLD
uniref:SANT domain-containing protein n=1 Tax=Rhabditophanes sp. KR3021 TaxID=114890 RepID=A0AC35TTE9_9BILA